MIAFRSDGYSRYSHTNSKRSMFHSLWVQPALPAGPRFNIAQFLQRMADGIRDGKSASPGFDLALTRHRLLDAIQKASDSGVRRVP